MAEQVKHKVLHSTYVQQAIDDFRATNPTIPRSVVENNAKQILNNLCADYEESTFRSFAYVVVKVLQQLYNGIHVSEQQMERLREISKRAEREKIPLILLPTHKSHMYFFFHFI